MKSVHPTDHEDDNKVMLIKSEILIADEQYRLYRDLRDQWKIFPDRRVGNWVLQAADVVETEFGLAKALDFLLSAFRDADGHIDAPHGDIQEMLRRMTDRLRTFLGDLE